MKLKVFRLSVFSLTLALGSLSACSPRLQPHYVPQNLTTGIDNRIVPDSAFTTMIAPYKSQLDAKMNRVIGKAAVELNKTGIEHPLGNFMADLLQAQAVKYGGDSVQMGMTSSGGLRIPIPAGDITVGEMFELMPFENEIWVLTLDGKTVQQLFDHLAKVKNLSVSHSQVLVENGVAKQVIIQGRPLDPAGTYTLATTDYLALGGDDLSFLKQAKSVRSLNVKFRDAIIDYIEKLSQNGKQVDARVEGRVLVR